MTRAKFSFLPAFFLVLLVVFGIAVFLRVRAYQTTDELPRELTRTSAPAPSTTHEAASVALTDTGRIVEIAPDGTTTGTSERDRSAAALAREQRYNELLRAAPPGPPGPPQAPPQTMFQKIVTPIANALGMSDKKPATPPHPVQPVRPTPQQLAQQQAQQQQQQQQQQEKESGRSEEPKKQSDEESDTKPPQLLGVEFIPNQVQDGSETTLVLTVTDDLSGVRSVSGVIAGPTGGALQGFAGQREGESNRYMARIQVPADAAAGFWKINYISLSDNAGNSIQLTAAQGMLPQSAAFQVKSAQSDSKGPTMTNVWMDKDAIRAGEKVTIFVDATDDKSGVSIASGVFVSPAKHARLGFGCHPGPEGSTVWECDFTPAANVECGLWQLEQIQLQDKARNMSTFRVDVPAVKAVQLSISGIGCDSTVPELISIALNPLNVSNAEPSSINVIAMARDDISGVAHINAQAFGPSGPSGAKVSFSLASPDGGQTWTGVINLSKNAPSGTWTIGWVQVIDKAQNIHPYTSADPVLAGVKFEVE